jgi:peptide deformylase
MLLKIVQVGDPVLRAVARPLARDEIRSPAIQTLIELMRETMRDAPGVGLAAPQIGEGIKLVVIEDAREDARTQRAVVPFQVLANPQLEVLDATPMEFFEGCLSLSGFSAIVPRALAVRVSALDHQGDPVTLEARGWAARILQHEIDHLNGTIYIDRMRSRTFSSQTNFSRHWADKDVEEIVRIVDAGRAP